MVKILVTILIVLILIGVAFMYSVPDYEPEVHIVEFSLSNNEKIYLKKMTWGITGDNTVIVLSKSDSKKFDYDKSDQYAYKGIFPGQSKFIVERRKFN